MRFVVKPIPNGHAMRWRAAYCVVDTDKEGAMYPDLGWTHAWVDSVEQGQEKIEEITTQAAYETMIEGTKAEGV